MRRATSSGDEEPVPGSSSDVQVGWSPSARALRLDTRRTCLIKPPAAWGSPTGGAVTGGAAPLTAGSGSVSISRQGPGDLRAQRARASDRSQPSAPPPRGSPTSGRSWGSQGGLAGHLHAGSGPYPAHCEVSHHGNRHSALPGRLSTPLCRCHSQPPPSLGGGRGMPLTYLPHGFGSSSVRLCRDARPIAAATLSRNGRVLSSGGQCNRCP